MPALPRFPACAGERVCLRPLAERDIPEILLAYQDDREMHLSLGRPRPPSGAELGRRCELAEEDRLAGRTLWLTVTRAQDDTCVGQAEVHSIDWDSRRAELGVWLAPAVRGQGLGREALRRLATWLLVEAELLRVALVCRPENLALRAAARAAGFQEEGVLRGHALEQGRRVDKLVLSLVAADLAS
jgi:ribosomal-protein-alanine N-acetyltransferase